jgi:hypothetical protein
MTSCGIRFPDRQGAQSAKNLDGYTKFKIQYDANPKASIWDMD